MINKNENFLHMHVLTLSHWTRPKENKIKCMQHFFNVRLYDLVARNKITMCVLCIPKFLQKNAVHYLCKDSVLWSTSNVFQIIILFSWFCVKELRLRTYFPSQPKVNIVRSLTIYGLQCTRNVVYTVKER